jgi:hypothetical protein
MQFMCLYAGHGRSHIVTKFPYLLENQTLESNSAGIHGIAEPIKPEIL